MEMPKHAKLEITRLPLDAVKPWEGNARVHTKRNLEALRKSLSEFGQYKPIVVQKSTMRIVAGNGTYEAAAAIGWDSIDCNILDLSDAAAKALHILDNRTGDLSEWGEKELCDSLKELKALGNLALSGFEEVELEKMVAFQEGDMFERLKPAPVKEKAAPPPPKPEPAPEQGQTGGDAPAPAEAPPAPQKPAEAAYDRQIAFTIAGFVYALSDAAKAEELRCLTALLKDAPEADRKAVNDAVFEAITEILTNKFMR